MEGKRTDRRIRKTKARLFQALMTLMQEKDIKDISVKELSDLALSLIHIYMCIRDRITLYSIPSPHPFSL